MRSFSYNSKAVEPKKQNTFDKIELYGSDRFNVEDFGRKFYSDISSSNHSAEVHKKVDDLNLLMVDIETILREKVRENYPYFMEANKEIFRISSEMSELKILVENTQQLVEGARAYCNDSQTFRVSDIAFVPRENTSAIAIEPQSKQDFAELSSIPAWIVNISQDLDRFIIEQQFKLAVTTIARARAYLKTVTGVVDEQTEALSEIRKAISSKTEYLATVLKQSLSKLPHSEIWGLSEHHRRLKLLVALGRSDYAAEAFSENQGFLMRRALRSVETSGDAYLYSSSISRTFFTALTESCGVYRKLFVSVNSISEEDRDVIQPIDLERRINSMLGYLMSWTLDRIQEFVDMLSNQIHLGMSERTTSLLDKLRKVSRGSVSGSSGLGTHFTLSTAGIECPMCFASRCLNVAFSDAIQLDVLGLHGRVSLGWMLVSDLSAMTRAYGDKLVSETVSQVRLDDWTTSYKTSQNVLKLRHPTTPPASKPAGPTSNDVAVSGSCLWLVSCLQIFLEDIWCLLNGFISVNRKEKMDEPAYRRQDVCEVEPEMVACFCRIVVAYVKAIETEVMSGDSGSDVSGNGSTEVTRTSNGSAWKNQPERKVVLQETISALYKSILPSIGLLFGWSIADSAILKLNDELMQTVKQTLMSKLEQLLKYLSV